jgi:hypothetical protein
LGRRNMLDACTNVQSTKQKKVTATILKIFQNLLRAGAGVMVIFMGRTVTWMERRVRP